MEYMRLRTLLETLCPLYGPSGFEAPVVGRAEELLRPLMDEVHVDRMGSLIGVRRCGKSGAKKVLLDAHLDEIGLITLGGEGQFLRFRAIGGVDPRMLPDREVMILTDPPVCGIVACLPPHVLSAADSNKASPIDELWIDTGLDQAAERIPPGTPAVFREGCRPLGMRQMSGKAMDDRACFAVLLYAAELLQNKALNVDLYLLGSTREETSSGGAMAAVYAVAPDCCVAVDVTHGRTPDASKSKTLELGKGPAVGVGPNMSRAITARLMDCAKAVGLPYQMEIMEGSSGTNAWEMQVAREGIATGVLSLPLKYMHSPVETLNLDDLETAARLLCAFVESLGEEDALCCSTQ